ncbi:MAG: hypothetical protein IM674_04265 [Brevundimonas sp.]|nr:hypothetical protein [Brevundimonas sp.]
MTTDRTLPHPSLLAANVPPPVRDYIDACFQEHAKQLDAKIDRFNAIVSRLEAITNGHVGNLTARLNQLDALTRLPISQRKLQHLVQLLGQEAQP